jgi:hypothetical protein
MSSVMTISPKMLALALLAAAVSTTKAVATTTEDVLFSTILSTDLTLMLGNRLLSYPSANLGGDTMQWPIYTHWESAFGAETHTEGTITWRVKLEAYLLDHFESELGPQRRQLAPLDGVGDEYSFMDHTGEGDVHIGCSSADHQVTDHTVMDPDYDPQNPFENEYSYTRQARPSSSTPTIRTPPS